MRTEPCARPSTTLAREDGSLIAGAIDYRHLYVHVPFCARRCSYCDFSIAVRRTVPFQAFARAVGEELRIRSASYAVSRLDTLYFGGGTPSRLGADGVTELVDTVRTFVALSSDAEVTLEANPEDITPAAVAAWRACGVNRVSIGVQSFDDRVLRWMHRVHDADQAIRAVNIVRDGGIHAISLDLIFAVPSVLDRSWSRDLDTLLALAPQHVSLYGLTIEPFTPLGRWRDRGDALETDDDRYGAEFLNASERLGQGGFEHYEVSNFALPGQRARHNSAYWKNAAYLGIGPSAHGFDGGARRWNIGAYAAWHATVCKGIDPVEGAETLTESNRVAESVYLGLRTRDGLAVTATEMQHAQRWLEAEWVERVESVGETRGEYAHPGGVPAPGARLRCTLQGWLRLDALAADLTAIRSRS